MERFKRLFISTSLLIGAMQTGMPVTTNAFTQNEKVSPTSVSSGDSRPKAIQARDSSDESGVGEKDATPPAPPVVNDITDQTTLVSGKVAPRATVILKIGTKSFGPVTASGTGEFEFIVDRQQAGLTAIVMVIDAEGNVSGETRMTVKDVTPPDAPQVDDGIDVVTRVVGTTEPFVKVVVRLSSREIGFAQADGSGRYEVFFSPQSENVQLRIVAVDKAGNESKATLLNARDALPPPAPMIFHEVTDKTIVIKGKARESSSVVIKAGDKTIGSSPVSSSDGNYESFISPQEGGTRLKVIAVDYEGNASEATEIVVKDTTPPLMPSVKSVSDRSVLVSGTTEPNATVTVRVNGKIIGKKSASKDGAYGVSIAKQKAGTVLLVQSTDKSGNVGKPQKTVVVDETPPSVPTLNPVSDQSTTISGRAEADAKVYIEIGSDVIGTVIAKKGAYSIKIIEQKAGTKLTVRAIDVSGNQSAKRRVIVQDRTAPTISKVDKLKRTDTFVSGSAESRAKIVVLQGSRKIGEGMVDGKGGFKVKIKNQKVGSVLTIRAFDGSGNRSKDKMITVG